MAGPSPRTPSGSDIHDGKAGDRRPISEAICRAANGMAEDDQVGETAASRFDAATGRRSRPRRPRPRYPATRSTTSCPTRVKAVASAVPTFPAPMMATCMMFLRDHARTVRSLIAALVDTATICS